MNDIDCLYVRMSDLERMVDRALDEGTSRYGELKQRVAALERASAPNGWAVDESPFEAMDVCTCTHWWCDHNDDGSCDCGCKWFSLDHHGPETVPASPAPEPDVDPVLLAISEAYRCLVDQEYPENDRLLRLRNAWRCCHGISLMRSVDVEPEIMAYGVTS